MNNDIVFEQLGVSDEVKNPVIKKILDAVVPYSMFHETGIIFSMVYIVYVIKNGLSDSILGCGTWRGDCSVSMLLVQRGLFGKVLKPVYMLDSFEGLPRVDHRDGPLADEWPAGVDQEKIFGNCKAAQEDLESLLRQHQFKGSAYKLVRGWFENTVLNVASYLLPQGLAVLRLDGDWYASTEVTLKHRCPITDERGVVIVDDYYAWDGCTRAVHDYLSSNDLSYRIKSLPYKFGAYFIKRAYRTNFNEF